MSHKARARTWPRGARIGDDASARATHDRLRLEAARGKRHTRARPCAWRRAQHAVRAEPGGKGFRRRLRGAREGARTSCSLAALFCAFTSASALASAASAWPMRAFSASTSACSLPRAFARAIGACRWRPDRAQVRQRTCRHGSSAARLRGGRGSARGQAATRGEMIGELRRGAGASAAHLVLGLELLARRLERELGGVRARPLGLDVAPLLGERRRGARDERGLIERLHLRGSYP